MRKAVIFSVCLLTFVSCGGESEKVTKLDLPINDRVLYMDLGEPEQVAATIECERGEADVVEIRVELDPGKWERQRFEC